MEGGIQLINLRLFEIKLKAVRKYLKNGEEFECEIANSSYSIKNGEFIILVELFMGNCSFFVF